MIVLVNFDGAQFYRAKCTQNGKRAQSVEFFRNWLFFRTFCKSEPKSEIKEKNNQTNIKWEIDQFSLIMTNQTQNYK